MAFDGTEGEIIPYAEAHTMTEDFQANNLGHVKAIFIGKDKINDILNQPNCEGIRIYYAQDANGPTLVLVGAESNEDDMVSGDIVNRGKQAPPFSGNANDLNND